ncbi:DUF4440 domain-containing protein [Nocardia sp. R6R-6]|uniref:DUF4440 domain-containing protein n=1 Tax=Nocardia sp. R6R-6 TaxID=3459303 RepID=UPI00403D83B4
MSRKDHDQDCRIGFLTRRFSEALNSGDAEALAAVFESDALIVTQPGVAVRPRDQEHGGAGFDSLDAHLGAVYVAGDVALLFVEWEVHACDPVTGRRSRSRGRSSDVGRRGPDGVWRCIIDNGGGSGPTDAPTALGRSDDELDARVGHLVAHFRDGVARGDREALANLFEAEAVHATAPGTAVAVSSHADVLDAYLAVEHFRSAVRHAYVTDGVAHLITDWELLERSSEDGGLVRRAGASADVARLGADGVWRYAVHNPFGTAPYRDAHEDLTAPAQGA